MDLSSLLSPGAITAFTEVILIDLVLAGDNAIVVGAPLVLRIGFALIVTQLMQVIGLVFAGGLLLLWVAWKMYRELRHKDQSAGSDEIWGDERSGVRPSKSF